MKTLIAALTPLGLAILLQTASAADWITAPSYFTHDPETGERVRQYAPIGPFYIYPRGDYRTSGYRHTRSTIQVGTSADNLHIVEEWGRPVRPYGEWRFPYRPYSVPYDLWAPPYPFYGSFFGFGGGYGQPYGASPHPYGAAGAPYGPGGAGAGHPGPYARAGEYPPWINGRYEPYSRTGHRRFPVPPPGGHGHPGGPGGPHPGGPGGPHPGGPGPPHGGPPDPGGP